MRVIGLAGWSGAGKTTLVVTLIPLLKQRGLTVSTIKHAHHTFDVDDPGKDSYQHRQAGATEVLVASANRWALMHELRDAPEPRLSQLLPKLNTVDLVIVEGFKLEGHIKIEVYRRANNKPFLHPLDASIKALVSDLPSLTFNLPHASIDDSAAVMDLVLRQALPLDQTLERLAVASRV